MNLYSVKNKYATNEMWLNNVWDTNHKNVRHTRMRARTDKHTHTHTHTYIYMEPYIISQTVYGLKGLQHSPEVV